MKKKEFKKYECFYTNDVPIQFKDLSILPVKMVDYFTFQIASRCLLLEKDKVPDIKVLSMSYLEFLLYLMNQKEGKQKEIANCLEKSFYYMCSLCIKDCANIKIIYDNKGKPCIEFTINNDTDIKKIILKRKDFEELKDIILFQNLPNYDNKYVNSDLQKEIDTINELKMKSIQIPSLELKKVTLCLNSGYTLEQLDNITLRKFDLLLSQSGDIMEYKIMRAAEMSGMVTFKSKIEHYLYKNKPSKTNSALSDYGQFKDKMSKVAK